MIFLEIKRNLFSSMWHPFLPFFCLYYVLFHILYQQLFYVQTYSHTLYFVRNDFFRKGNLFSLMYFFKFYLAIIVLLQIFVLYFGYIISYFSLVTFLSKVFTEFNGVFLVYIKIKLERKAISNDYFCFSLLSFLFTQCVFDFFCSFFVIFFLTISFI